MGLDRRADRTEQMQPSGAPPRLKVSRDAAGGLRLKGEGEPDPEDRKEAVEAAERPVTPDDPRFGPMRDVPPVGGA